MSTGFKLEIGKFDVTLILEYHGLCMRFHVNAPEKIKNLDTTTKWGKFDMCPTTGHQYIKWSQTEIVIYMTKPDDGGDIMLTIDSSAQLTGTLLDALSKWKAMYVD